LIETRLADHKFEHTMQIFREELVKALDAIAARVDGSYEVVVMGFGRNKCDEVGGRGEGSECNE
jgi:hypothetical protein